MSWGRQRKVNSIARKTFQQWLWTLVPNAFQHPSCLSKHFPQEEWLPHESRRTPAMSAQTKLSINLVRWWGLEPHSPSRSSASTYSSNQLFQSRNATRLRKWLVSIHILHRIVGHPFLKVSSQPTPKYNTKILYGSSIILTFFHFFLSFSKCMYPL